MKWILWLLGTWRRRKKAHFFLTTYKEEELTYTAKSFHYNEELAKSLLYVMERYEDEKGFILSVVTRFFTLHPMERNKFIKHLYNNDYGE